MKLSVNTTTQFIQYVSFDFCTPLTITLDFFKMDVIYIHCVLQRQIVIRAYYFSPHYLSHDWIWYHDNTSSHSFAICKQVLKKLSVMLMMHLRYCSLWFLPIPELNKIQEKQLCVRFRAQQYCYIRNSLK